MALHKEGISHFLKFIFAGINATADTLFAGNIVTCEKCSVFVFRGFFLACDTVDKFFPFLVPFDTAMAKMTFETRQLLESLVKVHLIESQVTRIHRNSQ
jgi:hypothetical protein